MFGLLVTLVAAQSFTYRVSWVGNTFGGAEGKWVSQNMVDLAVAPDGTCYTICLWDENGRELGIFREGQILGRGPYKQFTHGWGYDGGTAIAVNEKYVFFAQQVGNEGGHLVDPATWPPKGFSWFGIARRLRADVARAEPFEGAKGGRGGTLAGSFLPVHELPPGERGHLAGLACDETRLYASDPRGERILVYDVATMTALGEWPCARPGRLALDGRGRLWVIQTAGAGQPARLVTFDTTGGQIAVQPLHPDLVPVDLALAGDQLWLADNGVWQQVRVFTGPPGALRQTAVLGAPRGLYGEPAGRIGEQRFGGLTGVGVDAAGHVYVAQNGVGPESLGNGARLECYSPGRQRRWELLGLQFVDNAVVDPASDGRDVYTAHERFELDLAATEPGGEWRYTAHTVNRFRYPAEPRLRWGTYAFALRRIEGQRFLYTTDMYTDHIAIFRFQPATDGEIAIPAGLLAAKPGDGVYPPGAPPGVESLWRDANGNGQFEADEYQAGAGDGRAWGRWVDSRGDIWQAFEGRRGLRRLPCAGLDEAGNPRYGYDTATTEPTPAPFNDLQRILYQPETDTMWLAGHTTDHPKQDWKHVGKVLCRYDGWSTGDRTADLTLVLPYEAAEGHGKRKPVSFTVAGDYLFVVYMNPAEVEVRRTTDGSLVGIMKPGPEVGDYSGWVDIPYGVQAFRRADGEYLVFVEEDARAKVILYRWRPE